MITVHLRFYEELNDFLPAAKRKIRFHKQLLLPTTVKDLIESCGVPHTEIDLIMVNSKSVSFDYLIKDQDDISIYPVFESLDITGVTLLRKRPLRHLKFIADLPLGKLVKRLRLLGLDVVHTKDEKGRGIISRSVQEKRVLLTRSPQLLMFKAITHGYCVRSDQVGEQVAEVLRRFDLGLSIKPFSRCTACNGILNAVPKEKITEQLEPLTKQYYSEFYQCDECDKIYWPGSHYRKLKQFVQKMTEFLSE